MSTAPSHRPSAYRYGVILALLVFVRWIEVATHGTPWRLRFAESPLLWWSLLCVAAIACRLAMEPMRRNFPPAITILLSMLVGACCTLAVSSIPGMAIGLVCALCYTWEAGREVMRIVWRTVFRCVLPATVAGMGLGFVGSAFQLWDVHPPYLAEAAVIALLLFAAGILWTTFLNDASRTWVGFVLGVCAFFLFALATEPAGVMLDRHRRNVLLQPRSYLYAYDLARPHVGYLVHGWQSGVELGLTSGLTEQDARHLQAFPHIRLVWCGGGRDGRFSLEGFRGVDWREVGELHANHTPFTDETLQAFAGSTQMRTLGLRGSQVTDAGLSALSKMVRLGTLELSETKIDGSGLRHLAADTPLNQLRLSGTRVTDEALSAVKGLSLGQLILNDTPVRGACFAAMDKQFLRHLSLAHSHFDPSFLPDLFPGVYVELDLDGIHFEPADLKPLENAKGLCRLSLRRSGVTDPALAALAPLRQLERLHVEATHLTLKSASQLGKIPKVELSYDGALPLSTIRDRYEALASAIRGQQREQNLSAPPDGEPVTLAIYGLEVDEQVAANLREFPDCRLHDAVIGTQVLSLDREDLWHHFPTIMQVSTPLDDEDL